MSVQKEVLAENVTLFQGDCREVIPRLNRPSAIICDPPYGLGEKWQGGRAATKAKWKLNDGGAECEWDAVTDPFVLTLPDRADICVIWGGHLYNLPPARGWLIWDKIVRNFTSGHCELAWTTFDQPVRAFNFAHAQLASEGKFHPTQKPLALMEWCIREARVPAGGVICDPYMGAGSSGVAAVRSGYGFAGVELQPRYFDIACRRISDELRRPRLFAEPIAKPVQEALFS